MDPDRFRHTMGHLPTGVTVVTVRDEAGRPFGITVSATSSLSLQPAMLLVCIDRQAALHRLVVEAEMFGMNVLAADQADLARRFADREHHGLDDSITAVSPAGLPLLGGALAHLDIRRGAVYDGGDHSIITGAVLWSETRDGRPLCYFRSAYTGLVP